MLKKLYISYILFFSILCIFFSSDKTVNTETINSDKLYFPIEYKAFSSYYGYREFNGKPNFHNGLDIPAPSGTNIFATDSGIIINSSFITGYGNCVIILHSNGTKSLYGHLSENYIVQNGQYVEKGEHIGYVGPKYLSDGRLNGYTTGCHLHFTIFLSDGKTSDPLTFEYINK